MAGGPNRRARRAFTAALVRLGAAVLLASALALAASGPAGARVVRIHGRAYGEMQGPKALGPRMLRPRARGLSSPAGRFAPLTVGGPQPPLTYGGGPLMLSSTLHLIFWGPEGSFSKSYTEPIVQYARDLQSDESLTTDEFSVAELYANAAAAHITGKVTFGGDVFDTTAYPALDKAEGCLAAPCVTDSQIQSEVLNQIKAQGWPTDAAQAPEAQYLLFTPSGVGSCDGPGSCSFSEEGFCAYHGQITGIAPGGRVATYSDLPDEPACDSGQAPAGVGGDADADGTLDSEIHEIVESATDPSPETGYVDAERNEIADKCTYPVVETQADIYGTPLGGSLSEDTAFNQLIGGHGYYTQQLWSNSPTQTPATSAAAGCVARIGPTPSFTAPASGQTGQAVSFDASGSYDISSPIATYEWNYGDGSPVDRASGASAKHTYLVPATYQVSLTVSDSSGSADASTQTLPITIGGSAIGPPTASIAAPADHQTYALAQAVATSFSCAEAPGGPGIAACTDSNGATSPGALDTATAGPHSYTVTARSLDGLSATATIEYTVTSPSTTPGGGGGNPGSGGANTGSGTSGAGSGSTGGSASSSAASSTSLGAGATSAPDSAKPAALTRAQRLAHALKACQKVKQSRKRAGCIAAAKKRFAPARSGHRKAKQGRRRQPAGSQQRRF
jgi:hypothetical protein